jgi:hypothetical protein
MQKDAAAIRTYFMKLGLENEIADIYLTLHVNGPQTISELARNSHVERTRIYRLLDGLTASNLIEVESHYKRGIIKAAPIANLHMLIGQKEQELKSLQDEFSLIEQVLGRNNSLSDPTTRIQSYRGSEGIRQMQWNLFRAKNEVLSILHEPMQNGTGNAFFKRWVEKWNEGDWKIRLVFDEHFLGQSNLWHREHAGVVPKSHYSRVLDPAVTPIKLEMDIYNDVVAYYNWHDGEVFGIEVYNKDIANFQRTFFEMLWALATPPKEDLGRAKEN